MVRLLETALSKINGLFPKKKTIDIQDHIPNAINFTYKEFIVSQTAARRGISNMPTRDHWNDIVLLAQNVLQPLRSQFGPLRISSGYRSPALNRAIKGSPHSNHCRGQAADVIPLGNHSLVKMMDWIHYNVPYRELIFEYGEWIHVAYRRNGNVRKIKIKNKDYNYRVVTIDELHQILGD